MNILAEVLRNDVFPALGCTEPIAVAYAASLAGEQLEGAVSEVHISGDADGTILDIMIEKTTRS